MRIASCMWLALDKKNIIKYRITEFTWIFISNPVTRMPVLKQITPIALVDDLSSVIIFVGEELCVGVIYTTNLWVKSLHQTSNHLLKQKLDFTCQTVPLLRTTYKEPLESNVPANASTSFLVTSDRMNSCLYAIIVSIDVMISHKLISSSVLDIWAMVNGWFVLHLNLKKNED